MTEYWKSNPRKYCEICKCWMGDDKMTQQIHENGNRHKANVQMKIRESLKKGRELEKSDRDTKNNLQKMNEGALQGMMSDLARDPLMAKRYGIHLSDSATQDLQKQHANKKSTDDETSSSSAEIPPAILKALMQSSTSEGESVGQFSAWRTAKTPDGQVYYWNSMTRETKWINPATENEEINGVRSEKNRLNEFYKERLKDLKKDGDGDDDKEKEDEDLKGEAAESRKKKSKHSKKPPPLPDDRVAGVVETRSSTGLTENEIALMKLQQWTTVVPEKVRLPNLGLPAPHVGEVPASSTGWELVPLEEEIEIKEKTLKRPCTSAAVSTATSSTVSKVMFKKRKVNNDKTFRDPKAID